VLIALAALLYIHRVSGRTDRARPAADGCSGRLTAIEQARRAEEIHARQWALVRAEMSRDVMAPVNNGLTIAREPYCTITSLEEGAQRLRSSG
jgi:hypothetical protein